MNSFKVGYGCKKINPPETKNGLIPLSDETLIIKVLSVLADVLNLGIKLHGLNTASKKLLSAIDKVRDRERLKNIPGHCREMEN